LQYVVENNVFFAVSLIETFILQCLDLISMIGDTEKQKIIADIEGDSSITNYSLGSKYKHSPHSISTIRKKYEAQKLEAEKEKLEAKEKEGNIDVGSLKDMGVQMEYEKDVAPTRAQIEQLKAKAHSNRIIDKIEETLGEEDEAFERGKQLLKDEKKQKLFNEFYADLVKQKFNTAYPYTGTIWYTADMVNAYIIPRDKEISNLKQKISQMQADHTTELEQAKAQAEHDGYIRGISDGDIVNCYACGQPMSKKRLAIPCPNCNNQGWILQGR